MRSRSEPGSGLKEQICANYASRMAAHEFVALAFDPSYQGESGGQPCDLEDPAARVGDIHCAVDYLMTLPYAEEDRVDLLGICARYAISAALTEHCFEAVGTIVVVNIGRSNRQARMRPGAVREALEAVGRQRTAEARGGTQRRDKWIPDTPEEAQVAGITDRDLLDAVDSYRTPRGQNAKSTSRRFFRSTRRLIGFDASHLVRELLIQPLQVIGGQLGKIYSYDNGRALLERAPNAEYLFVIERADVTTYSRSRSTWTKRWKNWTASMDANLGICVYSG